MKLKRLSAGIHLPASAVALHVARLKLLISVMPGVKIYHCVMLVVCDTQSSRKDVLYAIMCLARKIRMGDAAHNAEVAGCEYVKTS